MPAKNTSPRLAAIRAQRDRVAEALGLEPALVGPRAVLEQIAERLDADRDPIAIPELRRWQWDLLSPPAGAPAG